MVGEFLPKHEQPANAGGNRLAQEWLSPEFMERFSRISDKRREELRAGAGDIALGLTENPPGLPEQHGDIVEVFAPIIMAAIPEAPIAKLVVADVILEGSPYDDRTKWTKAA
jgi:hypothetical protein